DLPRNFGAARRQFLARALGAALSGPNVVCVNSDFTGRRLAEHFDVDPARCFTVPPFVRAADIGSAQAGSAAPRYLFYPAVTWPHKRHDFLVDVAERLAERHRGKPAAELRFVLCGAPGPAHAAVMERIARSPAAGRFSHLGRVDAGRLAGLYRRAEALVFPSEYEGLGQPPLEAMAHGCPVLAGDHEALAETVGAGGEVLPPDADVWAAAVVGLAEPATRARLVDAGRARAAEFTPQRTAAAQLDAYRAAGPAR
ncbi:MAG TPA: hypothetical protein DEP66_06690, partial [Acidimicrobiaceae bacterium]|nr:hypothetical protein [Acidimicrobiaceae bacterium]